MSNRETVNHATATTPEFSMCSRICVFSTDFLFCQYNLSINLSDTLPFFLAALFCFFLDPKIGVWITCQKVSSDFLQKIELYCSVENKGFSPICSLRIWGKFLLPLISMHLVQTPSRQLLKVLELENFSRNSLDFL